MSAPGNVTTTRCHAWIVSPVRGAPLGFTDHDFDLLVKGVTCRASAGFTASSLMQSTGLSVDNTEAVGALRSDAITSSDIAGGLYDDAEVAIYRLDWQNPGAEPELQFLGHLGQITEKDGLFEAELRGLAETLNQPQGRVFHSACDAILGDARCGVDLDIPGYIAQAVVVAMRDKRVFEVEAVEGFEAGWFVRGMITVVDGAAKGQSIAIKNDRQEGNRRIIEAWQEVPLNVAVGDTVKLTAGCDKRLSTCRLKFNNILNFRGFPHIPGEDWLMSYPTSRQPMTGGQR